MQTQIHETQPDPVITLHTRRSVEVSTHTAHPVVIAARAAWESTPEPNAYRLQAKHRIEITVPQDAIVHVERVSGHLHLEGLPSGGQGKTIGGHLFASGVGPIRFDSRVGHAEIRQARGPIQCNRIGGHAHVVDVQGDCRLSKVGGHAALRGVAGSHQVEAGGHVEIEIDPRPRHTCSIKAGGHIDLAVPTAAPVRFHGQGAFHDDAHAGSAAPREGVVEAHWQSRGRVHITRTS